MNNKEQRNSPTAAIHAPLIAVQTAIEPFRYVSTDGSGDHSTGILTVTVQGERSGEDGSSTLSKHPRRLGKRIALD